MDDAEIISGLLRRGANDAWQLGLTEEQIAQFACYAALLVEWNAERLNLTRLVSPSDIAIKHFLDSLALLTVLPIPEGARVLDVGTGAGLPGLALQIVRPDLHITLLDGTAKKLAFCQAVADELSLSHIKTVHARAEDAGRTAEHAGRYDVVTARAVAPLEKLLPWLAPFARPDGGIIAALKGASVADELPPAHQVARRLGLALERPYPIKLPESGEEVWRQIVIGRR